MTALSVENASDVIEFAHHSERQFARLLDFYAIGWEYEPRTFAIDFDDGRYNILENAFPVMRACGFLGTMFVVTDLASGVEIGMNEFPALMWDDLALLLESGWSIEAHTKTHVTFGSPGNPPRDENQMVDEIVGAQGVIRERLGVPADHFVYPTGTFDTASERLVKQTYRTARLWQENPRPPPAFPYEYVTGSSDPYRLSGINISAKMSV